MRDVILYMSMSLDGFVGSDREHPGTAIPDAELKQWKLNRISKAGAHLMGRITYQEMSSYWPQSDDPYRAADERHPQGRVLEDAQRRRGHLARNPGHAGRPHDRDCRHQGRARPGRDRLGW